MTTTLVILRQRLSENINDYLSSTVTTALAASALVVDTSLANVEGGGTTDYFEDWWVLITSLANIGAVRRVSAYSSSTNTLTVQGGNFTSDSSSKATYELHRINPTLKTKAINNAARSLSSDIKRDLIDLSLVTGNILPDFYWWTSASAHKLWASSSATLARTAPSTLEGRGSRYIAKVTATAADGYMHLSNTQYPRLLDLKDTTVSAYVWAYPQVADDATIVIFTRKKDGTTTQTLTSTTSCASGMWTLLKLEDQDINDDLQTFQMRLNVTTDTKYVYFTKPRLVGRTIYDYMLPELFQDSEIREVRFQLTGSDSEDPADDIGHDEVYQEIFGTSIVAQDVIGTDYKFLRLPYYLPNSRLIELNGSVNLEDNLSSDTDTMSIDDPKSNLLIAQACWELFRQLRGFVGTSATTAYDDEISYWAGEVTRLKRKLSTKIKSHPIGWTL